MTYLDQATMAVNAGFRSRVKVAVVAAARAVRLQEQDPQTVSDQEYEDRQRAAITILLDPELRVETAVWALAADLTVAVDISDASLQTKVNAILLNLSAGI